MKFFATIAILDSFKRIVFLIFFGFLTGQLRAEDAGMGELSRHPRWLRLLHFDRKLGQSDIVNRKFFLAEDGQQNPESELVSSVDAFLNDKNIVPEEKRFACQFPARKRFIETQLKLKSSVSCPTFERWKKRAEPETIRFVHAAQYVGNPASAFGHSFLRFDRSDRWGLLGFSLTYSAKVDANDKGLMYALKGLMGGYEGVYEFDSYYPKVHGYGNLENRELWEYELHLSQEGRRWVFDHAWELNHFGQAKYYFLDRNCSYQLLRLLEVADEKLKLTNNINLFYLTPIETIKILAQNGLVEHGELRPSLKQRALTQYLKLNGEQREQVKEVVIGRLMPEEVVDPVTSSALVATLAINELEGEREPAGQSLFARSTAARSRLPTSATSFSKLSSNNSGLDPLQTHSSAQFRLGIVQYQKKSLAEFGVRPALHSLKDRPDGFLPYSQLLFLDASFQLESERKIRLRELTLVDVKSLQARSIVESGTSWSAHVGLSQMMTSICDDCLEFMSEGYIGFSFDAGARGLVYAMGGLAASTKGSSENLKLGAGPGGDFGYLLYLNSRFTMQFETKLNQFYFASLRNDQRLTANASASWTLDRESAISLRYFQTRDLQAGKAGPQEIGVQFSRHF